MALNHMLVRITEGSRTNLKVQVVFFSRTCWNDDASWRSSLSAWLSRRGSHAACLHRHRGHCCGERAAREKATDGFVGRSRCLRSPTGAEGAQAASPQSHLMSPQLEHQRNCAPPPPPPQTHTH